MKKNIYILFLSLIFACNTTTQKADKDKVQTKNKKEVTNIIKSSGNYSSLLEHYECDMESSEVAKILGVSEENVTTKKYSSNKKCYFNLSGYGSSSSQISWGIVPATKKGNKKRINNYLNDKKTLSKSIRKKIGTDFELAETGDCYLSQQSMHGRIIIYNEYYDSAFMLSYGNRNANNARTKEQQEELKQKMTDLANYLLKKHRK